MADAEAMLIAWATPRFPGSRVCTETPDKMETLPSVIRFVRAGGPQRFTLDSARVVIDVFAPTRQAARELCSTVVKAMAFELRGQVVDGVAVSLVETTSGPTWVPDTNPNLRHFTATQSLKLRDVA